MKRALQYTGLSVIGLGNKVFKNKCLSNALNRSMARKMTGMKGVPLKISQILGMSEQESSELHRQALEEIEAMSREQVTAILNKEIPGFMEDAVLHEKFFCASLGQVCHVSKDGQELAVKLQYPDSEKSMSFDGKAMNLMTSCFQNFSKGFDMSDYDRVLREELTQELDYLREVEMQHEFYKVFSDNDNIVIPLSMKKYSTASCLVMSWEPSLSLDEFLKTASKDQCKEASRLIVDFYLDSIFKHGLLHSDPNPGNFGFRLIRDKVQLIVYDFGSVVKLGEEAHRHLLSVFDLCLKNKNPLPALVDLGFNKDLLLPVSEKLPVLMMILLEPFLSKSSFSFDNWHRKEKINDILGDERWNFMAAAPAQLFLFMRSLHGLFYYTKKLAGTIYCQPILKQYLKMFSQDLDDLEKTYSADLMKVKSKVSSNLVISVRENGSQKVKLTLPVKAIDNLKNFIPPEVESKLAEKDISIKDLVSEVRQNIYKPQNVFSLTEVKKEISVYLQ